MRLINIAKKQVKFKRLLTSVDNFLEFKRGGNYSLDEIKTLDYIPLYYTKNDYYGLVLATELELKPEGKDIIMLDGIRINRDTPPYLEFVDLDFVVWRQIVSTRLVYSVKVLPTYVEFNMSVGRKQRVLCYNINKLPDNYNYDLVEKEMNLETVVTQNANDAEILDTLKDRMLKMSFKVFEKTAIKNNVRIFTDFDTYVRSLNTLTAKNKGNGLFHDISGSNPGKYGSEFHAIEAEVGSVLNMKEVIGVADMSSSASINHKNRGYKLRREHVHGFANLVNTVRRNSVPDPDVTT